MGKFKSIDFQKVPNVEIEIMVENILFFYKIKTTFN